MRGLVRRRVRWRLRPRGRAAAIRSAWSSVSRVNIRPSAARSRPGRSTPPASSAVRESRSPATRCAWVRASPISRRPHRASRPPSRWSSAMPARTRSTMNAVCPVSSQRADDDLAGLGVEVGGDLAVEVGGEPVADVGLDQALVVVRRRRVRVEAVEAGAGRPASPRPGRRRAARAARRASAGARTRRWPSRRWRSCRRSRAPSWRPRRGARTPTARRRRWLRGGRLRRAGSPRRAIPSCSQPSDSIMVTEPPTYQPVAACMCAVGTRPTRASRVG